MKKSLYLLLLAPALIAFSCNSPTPPPESATDTFKIFEDKFLDSYWKQYPTASINIGYGKYYENLVIPGKNTISGDIAFSELWLDSLNALKFDQLSDNNKISFNIIKNQLESDKWYKSVFKQYEWDASIYNISGECYYIINQPYAPLDDRLRTLTARLKSADAYYQAAFSMLNHPTKEHVELAIMQNQGGLSVFGEALTDSIKASHLSDSEKNMLNQNVAKSVAAMNAYVGALKNIVADKNYQFRHFSIGKEMFTEKFKYDLATDFTPEELYKKAIADNKKYYDNMIHLSDTLWVKYFKKQPKPKDNLVLIQQLVDKIQLQHAAPENFFDSLTSQVYQLKKYCVENDLFDFDTTYPIVVRYMPAYLSGFTVANAEFTPPYQKQGETYFNIDDLTKYPKEKAEGTLREDNDYTSQLLSIHEAVPGHCLQGIYNNKKSPDILRAVFQNGAMIEGWAVYGEEMILEHGWGNHSPELEFMHDKIMLRVLGNVIIDYEMQVLGKSKEDIMHFLTVDCFQTKAQADEKYKRATLSQVQLCSYYAGFSAIASLQEDYKKKMGDKYSLKDFHETFLSFGSSPVKYIRERMMQ